MTETTEELAAAAFETQERLNALRMMNTPQDYEDRKKAAIDLALAEEMAWRAQAKLNKHLRGETQ